MPSLVADTHAVAWYLLRSSRLSQVARDRMAAAVAAGDEILAPSICLVEFVYLVERARIPQAEWQKLAEALAADDCPIKIVPLSEAIAYAVARVPRIQVPDMPDRIIAATALHLGVPLVSRDRRIQASGLDVIW